MRRRRENRRLSRLCESIGVRSRKSTRLPGQHRLDFERRLRPVSGNGLKPHHVAGPETGRETFPQFLRFGIGHGIEGLHRRRRELQADHSASRIEGFGTLAKEGEPTSGGTQPPARPHLDPPRFRPRPVELEHQDHLPGSEISPAEPGTEPLQQPGAHRFDRRGSPQRLHVLPARSKLRSRRTRPERLGAGRLLPEQPIETPHQPLAETLGDGRSGSAREVADVPQPDPAQLRRGSGVEVESLYRKLSHLLRRAHGEARLRETGEPPGRAGSTRHRRPYRPSAGGENVPAVFQHGRLATEEVGGPRHIDQDLVHSPDHPGSVSLGEPRRRLHGPRFTLAIRRIRQQGRTPRAGVAPPHAGPHPRGLGRLRHGLHLRSAAHDRRHRRRPAASPNRRGQALRRQPGKPHAKHPSHRPAPPAMHAASSGAPAGASTATGALPGGAARGSLPSRSPPNPSRPRPQGARAPALPRPRPRAAAGDRARRTDPRPPRPPPHRLRAREVLPPPPRVPLPRHPPEPSPSGTDRGRDRQARGDRGEERPCARPCTTRPGRADANRPPQRTRWRPIRPPHAPALGPVHLRANRRLPLRQRWPEPVPGSPRRLRSGVAILPLSASCRCCDPLLRSLWFFSGSLYDASGTACQSVIGCPGSLERTDSSRRGGRRMRRRRAPSARCSMARDTMAGFAEPSRNTRVRHEGSRVLEDGIAFDQRSRCRRRRPVRREIARTRPISRFGCR